MTPIRTLILCPGLGRIARGYETFARECFDALSTEPRLDPYLFTGAGASTPRERVVWSLDRRGFLAECCGRLVGRNGYYIEQMTFALGMLPHIALLKPDVIFFSDVNLRTILWHWRRLNRLRYRLLLSNGGPVGPPFPRCEHVHQPTPSGFEETASTGFPIDRQTFVPYGFDIPREFPQLTATEISALRNRLGLPADRTIVLSVGALNSSHKRMDYIIREVSALHEPRPYLLLLGNIEPESDAIIRLGRELLGTDGFRAASVPQVEVRNYYRAADIFALASIKEGFGRVYVEALANGLLCLSHDYPVPRYILGEHGRYGDFRCAGGLANLIRSESKKRALADRLLRHTWAYEHFSWARLRDKYVDMIRHCAITPIGSPVGRVQAAANDGGRNSHEESTDRLDSKVHQAGRAEPFQTWTLSP